jgi:hypothetical protein
LRLVPEGCGKLRGSPLIPTPWYAWPHVVPSPWMWAGFSDSGLKIRKSRNDGTLLTLAAKRLQLPSRVL